MDVGDANVKIILGLDYLVHTLFVLCVKMEVVSHITLIKDGIMKNKMRQSRSQQDPILKIKEFDI
jgi:hypothetical protein